jgi:hypothetical protein
VGKDDTKDQVVTLPLYILAEERTRSSGESGTVILAVKDTPTFVDGREYTLLRQ